MKFVGAHAEVNETPILMAKVTGNQRSISQYILRFTLHNGHVAPDVNEERRKREKDGRNEERCPHKRDFIGSFLSFGVKEGYVCGLQMAEIDF